MKKTIKNKRKLRKGVKSILLLVLIAISISTVLSAFPTQEDHHAALGADGLLETTMAKIEALSPVYTPPPMLLTANDLICTNAILIEAEKNITLFEKNADTSVYPASVTKVLTALVALENIDNLNETVILQARDFESLYQAHASLSGFSEGDKLSYDDLLYSLMLVSGCDSAQALANNISGDNHSFSQLMNAKVDELQLRNSYFVNPSGLNHPDQYTTARDMAAIFSAALENQHFRQIIGSTVYHSTPTNQYPEGLDMQSYFFWRLEHDFSGTTLSNGFTILGGKTGYTKAAGLCLAAYGEKDGHYFVAVVFGGPGDTQGEQFNFIDTLKLFEQL